jgi:hypothetical protein
MARYFTVPNRSASLRKAHDAMSKKTTTAKAVAIPLNFPGKLSRTGWQLPDKLEFDQWTTCGKGLFQIEGAVQWWLGDWWVYGEHAYGERKALFEEGGQLESLNFGTLMNYGSVARRISPSHRCEVLSFKHHEHVASFPTCSAARMAQARRQRRMVVQTIEVGYRCRHSSGRRPSGQRRRDGAAEWRPSYRCPCSSSADRRGDPQGCGEQRQTEYRRTYLGHRRRSQFGEANH